ncbi:hypothetical protein D9M72_401150 [compost metagenome]
MQVSTQVIGRPPCTPPTMLLANSTSRREMPPVSIRLPARMKNGMAASGNLLIELNISFTEISMLALVTWMPRIDARPMDTATETDSAKHSTIVATITTLIARSPVRAAWDRENCRQCRTDRTRNRRAWPGRPTPSTGFRGRPSTARARAWRSPSPTRE